jgi:hypothetical protein
MNIWKQGALLGVNNNESNKLYGKKAWRKFIKTHQYYFVELNEPIKPAMIPMGYFRVPDKSNYLTYQRNFKYNGSFSKFKKSCRKIDSVLTEFNFNFFKTRHNPVFKAKEFGQFCILIKELYQHGAFNYPCWRVEKDLSIASHPGNHLNFVRRYLGLPLRGFISALNIDTYSLDFIKSNARIIKHIKTDNDIIEILGTSTIAASIQQFGDQLVPSLYPSVPRPVWSGYDKNGNTDWPWEDARDFYDYLESASYISIIDEVINSSNFTRTITQYATVYNDFGNETLLVNNFIAFLLTEQTKDLNFKLAER